MQGLPNFYDPYQAPTPLTPGYDGATPPNAFNYPALPAYETTGWDAGAPPIQEPQAPPPKKAFRRHHGQDDQYSVDQDKKPKEVKEVERKIKRFSSEMDKDATHIGCIFIVVWLLIYLFTDTFDAKKHKHLQNKEILELELLAGNAHADEEAEEGQGEAAITKQVSQYWRKRAAYLLLLWIFMIISSQIIIYIGLGWSYIYEASEFKRITNNTFCPGADNNRYRSDWKVDSSFYTAYPAQVITYIGIMLYMLAHVMFDWVRTHRMYRKFVRAVAPAPWLNSYGLPPSRRRFLVRIQVRYKYLIAFDLYLHVLMSCITFYIKMVIIFFICNVGKMISVAFGLEVLEKADDNAKSEALSLTPLARWMYLSERGHEKAHGITKEDENERVYQDERVDRMGGLILRIGEWIYHLLYFCVPALCVWACVWLALGCKPGKKNEIAIM